MSSCFKMIVNGKMREVLIDNNKRLIKPTTYTTDEVKHHVIDLRRMAGRKVVVAPLIKSGREEKKRELIVPPTALGSDQSVPTRRARTRVALH